MSLLYQWEETYKKGLLSFWVLLSLTERPMYAYEMREHITEFSQGSVSADEKSIYRALKRFVESGLIEGELRPSSVGPDRKYFDLTALGRELLSKFSQRNILPLGSKEVQSALNKLNNKKGKDDE